MKPRALLIHGWRVRDPARSIGRLVEPLQLLGYEVVMLRYGYVLGRARTAFAVRKFAKCWAARTRPGDVVIGHSNGCTLAFEMSHYGSLADTHVWINPSLDTDVVPGRSVRRVLVIYNPGDWVVRIGAQLVRNSVWGPMGFRGYVANGDPFGPDPRYTSVEHGDGHSDWRKSDDLANLIDRYVRSAPAVLMEAAPG